MPRFEAAPRQDAWSAGYPDDLLPQIQHALAALADIEVRHELDREYLEAWAGPEAIKTRLTAQLESRFQREREPCVRRLEQLQQQIRLLILPGCNVRPCDGNGR
jgi:hypothetical protein